MSNHKAVIGLGFGDEGKGITTDYLCSQSEKPLVVRFSGGHQAGHTVVHKGIKHVFSNFGAGTLRGADTYWSEYCTVDPIGIMNEYDMLVEKGVDPKIYIHPDSPVTTPYDKFFNRNDSDTKSHGTCGVGFGATVKRNEENCKMKFSDLQFPSIVDTKLDMICNYYGGDILPMEYSVKDFQSACEELLELNSILDYYHYTDYIYEGSQGLLLDKDIGFFPHVTRSNTGSKQLLDVCHTDHVRNNLEYCLVTRAYQTRHGAGPMSNNELDHKFTLNPNETNVTNEYQGDFRVSVLDIDLLKYAITSDEHINGSKKRTLVITCLDQVVDAWILTEKGNKMTFGNEDSFVNHITNALGIEKVIRVRSDVTDDIKGYDV